MKRNKKVAVKKAAKKVVTNTTVKKTVINKKKAPPTIFVQIAAYRDPELLPTIRHALEKADHPENLRFGIGWQYNPEDAWETQIDEIKNDDRFVIIGVDWRNAKGPCWIRHQINKLYGGETYTLQLDSHHRFSDHWDTQLIEMLEDLRKKGHQRPLLSSYLPSMEPSSWPESRVEDPWIMEFDRFAPEGPVHFLPHTIDEWRELDSPVPTRFISGHFIFADGEFVKDVPYDPDYYFHGEEINLSVRAYMAGYDLFAPHRPIIWHYYYRNGTPKHWEDDSTWLERDKASHAHNRNILGMDGNYDEQKTLTKHRRSLLDYEMYAGLEFKTRRAHLKTIEKVRPPISADTEEHYNGLASYHKVCVDVYRGEFTENDYDLWAVALEDADGNEICRADALEEEINQILSVPYEQDKFSHIWRTFYSDKQPTKWVVWPHSKSKGWTPRLTGQLGR
jgi:GT2 family glycosyltransferase